MRAALRAALALGAAGVQIGTAYLLCPEATTSAVHRAALCATRATTATALTNVFTGRPARGIVNRLMREVGPIRRVAPAFPLAGGGRSRRCERRPRRGPRRLFAAVGGQSARLGREMGAGDLTRLLAQGAVQRLKAMAASA